jgi:hypothetical protein
MGGAYCYFRRQPVSEDKDSGYAYHELTERNGTSDAVWEWEDDDRGRYMND